MPRPIDHLVLPVDSLAAARARYEALGFQVRENREHPFGTANCCIFFYNNTYLEPLAVADREKAEAAIVEGNNFVRRQDAYRFRHGEGFAMLALASTDADVDQKYFAALGYATGPVYAFERKAGDRDGAETTIGVRLAYAVDHRAPDVMIFTCQHLNPDALRDLSSAAHPNGALGVTGVYMAEANPADFQYYLEATTGQRAIRASSLGIEADTPNGIVAILTPDGIDALFGLPDNAATRGLRLCAFTLAVKGLDIVAKRLDDQGIDHRRQAGRLIVDAALGQGALIAFEEEAT
ncbi:MAG TPA: VOC family protein [Afifellaceae bacterium]|nr:VOC family protein [Afifellaceae bacterium]